MTSKKKLIILTKKFGFNFTGATLATHELLKFWVEDFNEIIIITKEVGKFEHNDKIKILHGDSYINLYKLVVKTKDEEAIYYSDDHLGFLLKLCGVNYFHTYHGNWPDARKINMDFWLKSFFFIPAYKLAIKNAKLVINVSYYMDRFTRKYNKNTLVIRNGLGQKKIIKESIIYHSIQKTINVKTRNLKIIMIGGVDRRKYYLANKLFNKFENNGLNKKIVVDIYGGIHDEKLGDMLNKYSFVNLKGHVNNIDLENYDILLNTSTIENLSISVTEAVFNNVPVITFNIGGLGEVVRNSRNGFLIPQFDVDKMAKKVEDIIYKGYTFHFYNSLLLEYDWKFASVEYLKQFSN